MKWTPSPRIKLQNMHSRTANADTCCLNTLNYIICYKISGFHWFRDKQGFIGLSAEHDVMPTLILLEAQTFVPFVPLMNYVFLVGPPKQIGPFSDNNLQTLENMYLGLFFFFVAIIIEREIQRFLGFSSWVLPFSV